VCHNHPYGNLQRSGSDQAITRKIKDYGLLMDVQLLDHLIITAEEDYYNFTGVTDVAVL
jgi:DNA repair protein RadC